MHIVAVSFERGTLQMKTQGSRIAWGRHTTWQEALSRVRCQEHAVRIETSTATVDAFNLARFALMHSQGLLNGHGTPDYAILVGWQPFAHIHTWYVRQGGATYWGSCLCNRCLTR